MRQVSFVNVGIIEPGRPARLAAARLRRAFVRPILAAPPVRATQPSILLQISVKAFSHGMNTGLFTGREPHTKQKKNFPLELRAKTLLNHLVQGQSSHIVCCRIHIQEAEIRILVKIDM